MRGCLRLERGHRPGRERPRPPPELPLHRRTAPGPVPVVRGIRRVRDGHLPGRSVSGALLGAARYLALALAVSLAVAETLINESRPEWQYAPLWIIDFAISAGLLAGFWLTRRGRWIPVLMAAYALALGVFYLRSEERRVGKEWRCRCWPYR